MAKRPYKHIRRIEELRAKLWPDIKPEDLWHRKQTKGFTTIPRTMPLICCIIDDMTKGSPASSTYLELWCRAFDEMYISLATPRILAFHAGFMGQRAERTWLNKILALDKLGFISVRPGQAGPHSHAIILNPYHAVQRLHEKKHPGLVEARYIALRERAGEIGASDIDPPKKSRALTDLSDDVPF